MLLIFVFQYVDIFFDFVVVFVGFIGIVFISNFDLLCENLFMFEFIYGFVFDIIGMGKVNFVVIFWIVVEMFEWLGEEQVFK